MLLSSNGQNIYPEEIESKLNNMEFVTESLIVEDDKKLLVALIVPDYDELKAKNLSEEDFTNTMDENLANLNKIVGIYEKVSRYKIRDEEFEKTPKKSIKRFLYNAEE
jgi:long-chain acyl-CoA synthetase